MDIKIYSRQAIEQLLKGDFPKNTAVISFSDPTGGDDACAPVVFGEKVKYVFKVAIHDIDLSVLPEFGLTYETYFPEAVPLRFWSIFTEMEFRFLQIIGIIQIRLCTIRSMMP